ncbi:hypothetical protein ACFYNL_05980 [Streptomyces sp. NPDC007808]|uniref:hypothetical protein n=1 Tax=Streptomyces sp. NPDC007808 TaxID=3364779 RepID=UPI0036BCB45C
MLQEIEAMAAALRKAAMTWTWSGAAVLVAAVVPGRAIPIGARQSRSARAS